MNYELDAYRSALKIFPKPEVKLQTEKGVAVLQKMDIFKEQLWYAYKGQWMNWHMLSLESVNEIIVKNNNKEKSQTIITTTNIINIKENGFFMEFDDIKKHHLVKNGTA